MSSLLESLRGALAPQYEVERELASGGMGTVFLARHVELDRRVAVKALSPQHASATARRRFLSEARILAGLSHPNIVSVHRAGQADGFPFYVMDYIEGETLSERLRRGPLPPGEVVQLGSDLLSALQAAHDSGVVHRDIKPSNVFMVGDRAVLGDFGIAKSLDDTSTRLTKSGDLVGTPAYMAPEQLIGEATPQTDLYAVGMILYEACTGRTWPIHVSPDQRDWSSTPENLLRVLRRALETSPAERWDDASAFRQALVPSESRAPLRRIARAASLGGAVTVILGVGWWLLHPARGVRQEARAGPPREAVLIAPFENRTEEPELENLGYMAADWIAGALTEIGVVQVVQSPRTVTGQVVAQVGSDVERVGPMTDVADKSGTDLLVWGSYYVQNDSVYMQARLTDLRSGEQVRSIMPVRASVEDPTEALKPLQERMIIAVANVFQPPLIAIPAGSPLPTYAAYREYTLGVEAYGRDNHKALERLFKAASIDTTFQQPLILAAVLIKDWRQWARADSVLAVVERSRNRLAPENRYLLDAIQAEVQGDWPAVYEATRRNAEYLGYRSFGVARAAVRVNRPQEAVEILLNLPKPKQGFLGTWQFWFLTGALHMLGEHRRELEEARRARARNPESLHEINFEVRALAALGMVVEIHDRLDESLNVRPPDWSPAKLMETGAIKHWSPGNIMETAAIELRAHGHREAYREAIDRAVDWFESRPSEEKETWYYRREYGRILYAAERWEEARLLFKRLAEEFPEHPEFVHFKGYLGALAARRGDHAEVERISEELRTLDRPYLFGSDTYWRACIAALLSQRKRAVQLLRDAITEGHSYYQIAGYPKWELHSDMDLESLREYGPFQDLLRPKG